MPHINEMQSPSKKYLNKEDIGKGALLTIRGVEQRNLGAESGKPEFKWIMFFDEQSKPLVLNSTNIQLAARACLSEQTEDWIGKKVVLYFDPNVSFQGKLTGGIRIRAPKQTVFKDGAATNHQPAMSTIKAAAARWTQSHAMPESTGPSEEMLTEDEVPF